MLAKLKPLYSVLALALVALYALPQARPYLATAATVLGALTVACTALASLPGKPGAFFAAVGHDVDALLALMPKPPSDGAKPAGPSVIVRAAGAALVALSVAAIGCAGALPAVVTVVSDGLCVLTHFDELLAAEKADAATFILVATRVAKDCGITVEAVVRAFGTEKASRAARAAKAEAATPACSAPAQASPVKP